MAASNKRASETLNTLSVILVKILPLLASVTIVGLVIGGTKLLRPAANHGPAIFYDVTDRANKQSLPSDQLFAFGSAALAEASKKLLADTAAKLQSEGAHKIIVIGHTDSIGDPARNQVLSQERANMVRLQLLQSGIEASSVEAVGAGDRYPIVPIDHCAATAKRKAGPEIVACLEKNRRVEIWSRPAH